MSRRFVLSILAVGTLALAGCYHLQASDGGGQTSFEGPREVEPADVGVPTGYKIEAIAVGLTFPTGIAFDEDGVPHVVEAGYSYGEIFTTPRLLRLEEGEDPEVVFEGENPPWNGIAHHEGDFFVAGGHVEGGKILRISHGGDVTVLIDDLPSRGDHHSNGPVIGPDGHLYFGQGVATNSAVVGLDNYEFGWLARAPEFHDVPCEDVVLAGQNFNTTNPLDSEEEEVETGAYTPFGTSTEAGQEVPGEIPCTGAVFRLYCNSCHPGGEAGLGSALNNKPLPGSVIRFQVRNGVGAMPSFGSDVIDEDELDAIIAYVVTLRRHDEDDS